MVVAYFKVMSSLRHFSVRCLKIMHNSKEITLVMGKSHKVVRFIVETSTTQRLCDTSTKFQKRQTGLNRVSGTSPPSEDSGHTVAKHVPRKIRNQNLLLPSFLLPN